jgi:flagellar basal body rod protein FlgC
MENRVVVDITDQAAFDKAIAEAGFQLPESVVVNSVYESVGESPPFEITPVPDVFMPQLKRRDVGFMEALLIGELVVDEGCLRVRGENENHLVIWQADYFLTDNNGVLEILDETGEVVARVGEPIYLGGGEQRTVDNAELRRPIPEACGGPYWRMGEFLPEEYIPKVASDNAANATSTAESDDGWQSVTIPEIGLAVTYPADWFMHSAGKAVEITPNAQPTWSSVFDPDQPNGGPAFLLMHNLNRQMAATPLAEVEAIVAGYEANIEVIEPAAPIPERPDVVSGVYRLVNDEKTVLLAGAAVNPLPDSPQPVVAMTAVGKTEDLPKVQPIFERILQSLRGV